ncbi:hypothetical protein GTU79_18170 [Sodalis ligni]|jgi:hypothetical protein|uniref:Uncharacterized protein n=1 Tax=Sodalis ligni TaxID=2697027 RepID=A0A4R1NJR0_9GAMM|nr:hypothetical protein [Sodalis ligni]QWA09320.1 hypothetical protein GTU79_18170 [Sodalis ligni]TCL07389.1 hypothetical protein EZJ58_5713 [Sodalis ligni]
MHTVLVVSGGLLLLGVFVLVAHFIAAVTLLAAVKVFIVVWLVVSLLNLWGGVTQGGYSLLEELPMLLLVFGIPAIFSLILLKWVTAG